MNTEELAASHLQSNAFLFVVRLTSSLAMALGAGVILLWFVLPPHMDGISPVIFEMKFNSALMLFLSGAGLISSNRKNRWLTAFCACTIISLSILILAEYIFSISLGIDELFIPDLWTPDAVHPGRSASNTVFAFLCVGVSLGLYAWKKPGAFRILWLEALGFMTFALGTAALVGHLESVRFAYSWGTYMIMSPHTAAGHMILGTGLMARAWLGEGRRIARIPLWVPAVLCLGVLIFDFSVPNDIASGIGYVPLVFCSLWFNRPQTTFIFAAISTFLIVLSYLATFTMGVHGWYHMANSGLVILVIWLLAWLIYAQRRALKGWNKSQRYLQAIVDNAIDGMITIDALGTIETLNPACERIFGYHADELIGQNIKILMPDRYSREHDGYLHNYMETGHAKIIGIGREVEGRRKDGSEFPIDLSVSEVRLGDRRIFSGILRDISYRKKAEADREKLVDQLHQSNTQLEQFAYICSHDLQEPLRMISNFTQRLEKHLDLSADSKARHYMQYITNGAANARTLISDVLQLARLNHETRKMEVVDCEAALNVVFHNLRDRIRDSNAEITHDELPRVMAHFTYVVQIFQNLISNAIKFRRDTAPHVHIAVKPVGDFWQISVRDNGIGIADKHQDKIFQIFQRLHSRATYPGTGIGLAIVKRIIQQYGGAIWLISVPGEGATFYFTLPMAEPEA